MTIITFPPPSNIGSVPAVGCCGGGWEYETLCGQQGQQVTVSFQVSGVAAGIQCHNDRNMFFYCSDM